MVVWVLGYDDEDLDWSDAEDEQSCNGEETDKTTACCVAAGQDAVE
jgi:hypothetical protein